MSLLLAAALALCAQARAELPEGYRLLDATGETKASWTLPLGRAGGCAVAVDPGAGPWLGCGSRFLIGPTYVVMYEADRAFESPTWLADGALLAVSGHDVGLLSLGKAIKSKKAIGKAPFKTLASFPGQAIRLFAGAGSNAYVAASGSEGTSLYLLSRGPKGWSRHKLFTTAGRVAAAAGDGRLTFVAMGRRVVGLGRKKDGSVELQLMLEHPDADVESLAFSPQLGLFYATAEAAGYLGGRFWFEFLRAPSPRLSIAGPDLVVLPSGGGALRLSGLQGYRARDAELAEDGVAAF